MPFCPSCGTESDASFNFCGHCGRTLPEPSAASPARTAPGISRGTLEYRIPPGRILLMTILSGGLYQFYWFYLTWMHYRDHTRSDVFPVWHAMCLGVPIYSLFRIHAHMRVFKDLMVDAGLESTISPVWAVTVILATQLLGVASFFFSGGFGSPAEITRLTALISLLVSTATVGVIAVLLVHVQGNINRYWVSREGITLVDANLGVGEVILAVIGVIQWLLTFVAIVNPGLMSGL